MLFAVEIRIASAAASTPWVFALNDLTAGAAIETDGLVVKPVVATLMVRAETLPELLTVELATVTLAAPAMVTVTTALAE